MSLRVNSEYLSVEECAYVSAAVVQTEFDAILRGCRAVHPDYRPQVSFVIAAKRVSGCNSVADISTT